MRIKFVKKPVVIEAIQYLTDNIFEIIEFLGDFPHSYLPSDQILVLRTLEGDMLVKHGDFVIKGAFGEFYPCKPDIFKETYSEV